jgi:hypothetical protein
MVGLDGGLVDADLVREFLDDYTMGLSLYCQVICSVLDEVPKTKT